MKKAKSERGNPLPGHEAVNPGSNHINNDGKPAGLLYNLSDLQKMSGNSDGFLNHAISIFIKSSEEATADLRKHLENEEWIKIREVAHKILPSYRHLEVNAVIPLLVELNNRINHDEEKANTPLLVNEIIREIETLLIELQKELH
jgi:HPt (histidine-containing phosphotransfer) domain-containing protein